MSIGSVTKIGPALITDPVSVQIINMAISASLEVVGQAILNNSAVSAAINLKANKYDVETPLTLNGANTSWNWTTQNNAVIYLNDNATLLAVNNIPCSGAYMSLKVIQSSSGGKVLSFTTSNYKGLSELSLSTKANAVDWLLFRSKDNTTVELIGYRTNVGA